MAPIDRKAAPAGLLEPSAPSILLAKARIALSILNFPLAYASHANRFELTDWPLWRGEAVCAAFFLWMVASHAALRSPRRPGFANLAVPLLDILAAVGLILATGAGDSPFQPWLNLVAFGTLVSRTWGEAALVGAASVAAILFTKLATPENPTLNSLTLVRAIWVGVFSGFGFLVAASREQLVRLLGGLETFSAEAGDATDAAQALDAFRRAVDTIARPTSVVVRLEVFEARTRPRLDAGPGWLRVPIVTGGHDLGEAHVGRSRKFAPHDRLALQLVGERLATTLIRIRLSAERVEEVARQERLALADELHDTTIQTLTALDLEATLLARLVAGDEEAQALAQGIAEGARGHVAHVRRFLRESVNERVPGPEALTQLFEERWSGRYELRFAPDIRLSEARWRLVLLLAREGLNNARKHGHATHVSLLLSDETGGFEARLEADGATPPGGARSGYGLTRLRAVAGAQSASVELRPRPGGGSVLAVRAGAREAA